MNGLMLRTQLARLHQQFDVVKDAVVIKPSPATAGAMLLSGYASTVTIDLDRMKFENNSMTWSTMPKLLFKHDADQVAGTIDDLHWDAKGLKITATVDHQQARTMNAFSVAVSIHQYQIINPNSPQFYASITKATLDEVSLVTTPANQFAIVTSRWPVPASNKFYDLMMAKVAVLQRLVPLLRPTNHQNLET